MLTAREFVDIDVNQPEKEKARLESIHSQLAQQNLEVKQQIIKDLLKIIESPDEKISTRNLACIILGGRRKDLGVAGSNAIVRRLRKVADGFVVSKPRGPLLREEIRLRDCHVLEFSFLESLLVTMVRIDFKNMHRFVETIVSKVERQDWQASLKKLLAGIIEREKLELQS